MNIKATPIIKRSFLFKMRVGLLNIAPGRLGNIDSPTNLRSNIIHSEKGIGKLTFLVFGSILSLLLYCAYCIIPFYYYYYELQNHFDSHARVAAVYTDTQIRDKLWYLIKKMEIPVEPQDLKIQRNSGEITISMSYNEIFYLTWQGKDYDLYTFHFNPKTTQQIISVK